MTAQTQALNRGRYRSSFLKRESHGYLTNARLRVLGGTTNHWRGWVRPLDPVDFERREWLPHSGWPIGFEDLKPYYVAAAPWLHIAPPPGVVDPHWRVRMVDDPVLEDVYYFFSRPTRFGLSIGSGCRPIRALQRSFRPTPSI